MSFFNRIFGLGRSTAKTPPAEPPDGKIGLTAYDLAGRFLGVKEIPGHVSNPAILAMLQLDNAWPQDDSVAWCSAFVNYVCHLLSPDIPRSRQLNARSWLGVGRAVELSEARVGFDVVILWRGAVPQPGPTVLDAPGHVGFFGGIFAGPGGPEVVLRGGNQGDAVDDMSFPADRILGIRRLLE